MKEPWFWRDPGLAARAIRASLAPATVLYDFGQRIGAATAKPLSAAAPVICIGNATLGGSGKTPFSIALAELLEANGVTVHFSTRGYGGRATGPALVKPDADFAEVGDEALLLATIAPTFVAKNRAAGARAAAHGADVVIMDDGFQNPTVLKACSILLVSGDESRFAQFPAGPMREPFERAVSRADAIVTSSSSSFVEGKPHFRIRSEISVEAQSKPVIAFCGIARPERFFEGLRRAGIIVAEEIAFGDHHAYVESEIESLRARARRASASLITTQKDHVRIPVGARNGIDYAPLILTIEDPEALKNFVIEKCGLTR